MSKILMNIVFIILVISRANAADSSVEQGLDYLFHSEFLGTLIGVKPISMLSFSLPRQAQVDLSLQAAVNDAKVKQLLSEKELRVHRFVSRPEWNPHVEVVYYMAINLRAVEKTLQDPQKSKFLKELGFTMNASIEENLKWVAGLIEHWNPRGMAPAEHAILGIFLGYPVTAVKSFLQNRENQAKDIKKQSFGFYQGPDKQFNLGAFTSTIASEELELETRLLQASSDRAVSKIVGERTLGNSFLNILDRWDNRKVLGKILACKNFFDP